MAQVTYRANLSAKTLPFISDNWGRTVIVPQYDNTFNRQVSSAEDQDRDVGIPQMYYMHNVMPHAQGFQSVGYLSVLAAHATETAFDSMNIIRDGANNIAYMGYTSTGKVYINTGAGWALKLTVAAGSVLTTAYVSGVPYIYLSGIGAYYYDFAGAAFVAVTLTGLDATKVQGITGSVGYLIAWSAPLAAQSLTFTTVIGSTILTGAVTTNLFINQQLSGTGIPVGAYIISIVPGVSITISAPATAAGAVSLTFEAMPSTVAWSSTIDPTDFVPSLITGAGGGAVEGARGSITFCVSHLLGFIVYTSSNAVAAIYSGNARFPFNFREIVSSGGLASLDLLSFDANSGNHYAYTTSGLQLISTSQTQTVFPEITDFVAGRLFEDFDETTDTLSLTSLSTTMQKHLNVISDRYLVISYGINSLTHCIVLDLIEKRYGKLKIPHTDVFEYQLTSSSITEIPRQSIGFLQADGTVKVVDFSVYSSASNGVIILGKYQFVRARTIQLDTVSVENVIDPNNFSLRILTALDGKNTAESVPALLSNAGRAQMYGTRAIGSNHSILCKGQFHLESLVLQFNTHGKR